MLFCYVSDGVRTVARAEQRVIYVIAKQEKKGKKVDLLLFMAFRCFTVPIIRQERTAITYAFQLYIPAA